MKKIVLLWLVLLLVLLPVSVFAEEVVDEEVTVETEEIVTDEVVADEDNTLFTRIFDFVDEHRQLIVMCLGFVLSIALSVKDWHKQKKTNLSTEEKQTNILSGVTGIVGSQNGVIDAVNQLSIGYDKMKQAYEQYESIEDDRNKLVGAVMIQTSTVLDIMASVYVNSNHLPQGEKDIILLKYSKCLAAMEDDEKLKACVNAVRNILGQYNKEEDAAQAQEGDAE